MLSAELFGPLLTRGQKKKESKNHSDASPGWLVLLNYDRHRVPSFNSKVSITVIKLHLRGDTYSILISLLFSSCSELCMEGAPGSTCTGRWATHGTHALGMMSRWEALLLAGPSDQSHSSLPLSHFLIHKTFFFFLPPCLLSFHCSTFSLLSYFSSIYAFFFL